MSRVRILDYLSRSGEKRRKDDRKKLRGDKGMCGEITSDPFNGMITTMDIYTFFN